MEVKTLVGLSNAFNVTADHVSIELASGQRLHIPVGEFPMLLDAIRWHQQLFPSATSTATP